ncbi:proline-rich proteoglycan 2-like [Choloepus didactylus]|uniref:proline-rich proteoglycan 2-like n=1 Tax=Choloepus didactylus TaxID=27675 RepID=UPI0018A0ACE7|nr:proline-rich proteoglycan 2-like [Choloepus didactylus]
MGEEQAVGGSLLSLGGLRAAAPLPPFMHLPWGCLDSQGPVVAPTTTKPSKIYPPHPFHVHRDPNGSQAGVQTGGRQFQASGSTQRSMGLPRAPEDSGCDVGVHGRQPSGLKNECAQALPQQDAATTPHFLVPWAGDHRCEGRSLRSSQDSPPSTHLELPPQTNPQKPRTKAPPPQDPPLQAHPPVTCPSDPPPTACPSGLRGARPPNPTPIDPPPKSVLKEPRSPRGRPRAPPSEPAPATEPRPLRALPSSPPT